MDASAFFPSKWLSAEDVGDRTVDATITGAVAEEVGSDRKLVVYFLGYKKGLVLNKTNYKRIKDAFGDETEKWKDKVVQLYTAMVPFKGEDVPALRIKIPEHQPEPPKTEEPKKEPAQGSGSLLDEAFSE